MSLLLAATWTVCLDPGHGGSDAGAVGQYYLEKDANLDVAFWAKAYLEQAETVIVGLTRDGDYYVSLADRVNYANSLGFDRFVSIHHNAYDGTVQGTETYCHPNASSESFDMRDTVHPWLLWAFGYPDRGARTADYYVLRNTVMPAILGEASFIDYSGDYDESWRFYTNWNRHAEREGYAYARGVCDHLGIPCPDFPERNAIWGTVEAGAARVQVFCYLNYSDSLVGYAEVPSGDTFRIEGLSADTLYDIVAYAPGYNPAFAPDLRPDTGVSLSLAIADTVVIVDNSDPRCLRLGEWHASEWSAELYGINYFWAGGGAPAKVSFSPELVPGTYDIYIWYTSGSNRATRAQVVVRGSAEVDTFFVDQTQGGGQWQLLGRLELGPGSSVEVSNEGLGEEVVIADAVKFSLVGSGAAEEGLKMRLLPVAGGFLFSLPEPAEVRVYDSAGRLVLKTRLSGAGRFRPALGPGVYVAFLRERAVKFVVK